jgi:hypothetical protein
MWRRDRGDLATLERGGSSSPAVAMVDDALRVASGRQLFTRAEAVGLLHQVEVVAHDLPAGARVVAIVNDVDRASENALMVSRSELMDPLLDIRLVLSS